jgi:hypothetical protein
LALASQLAVGRLTTPSASIMGSSGVKAKRPMPMATANESIPAAAACQGRSGEVIARDFVRRLITLPVTCHDRGLNTRTSP